MKYIVLYKILQLYKYYSLPRYSGVYTADSHSEEHMWIYIVWGVVIRLFIPYQYKTRESHGLVAIMTDKELLYKVFQFSLLVICI